MAEESLRMTGTLYGLGLGPGDPELLTLKAHRLLIAAPVVAYPSPENGDSFARRIAAPYLTADQIEVPIVVPMRLERFPAKEVYDDAAMTIGGHLDAGRDVAALCEGDPFFYGSFMYLFERLAVRYPCEIVPGISSIMAGAAAAGRPLAARNDVLTIIPGPLPDDEIERRLSATEAAVIIKIGRHFSRIRALLERMNLSASAGYLEHVSLTEERVLPIDAVGNESAPYFSMIVVYRGAEEWIAQLPIGGGNGEKSDA